MAHLVGIRPIGRLSRCSALAALSLLFLSGCEAFFPPLGVTERVDLERYAGRWYEIARYPNSFETGCVGVTADYEVRPDGRVDVINTCREANLDGNLRTIEGVARVTDTSTNAKLAVSFFWPFESAYWILELGEDYDYAVVGEPSRNYLWVLSREPVLDEDLYQAILGRLPGRGYDPDRLQRVAQVRNEE